MKMRSKTEEENWGGKIDNKVDDNLNDVEDDDPDQTDWRFIDEDNISKDFDINDA